jgi:hypothetical protein
VTTAGRLCRFWSGSVFEEAREWYR